MFESIKFFLNYPVLICLAFFAVHSALAKVKVTIMLKNPIKLFDSKAFPISASSTGYSSTYFTYA